MTTVVSVAQGGTGANNAASARTSLGAAPSAAYDAANNAYAAANTAFSTGGGGYAQANAAYNQANTARSDANTTFATINTTFSTVNTSLGTINTNYQAAYSQANTARDTANNAYNNSNTKLSTSGGSISGDLAITGNLTVQGNATTINVTNLSVNDSMILLSTGGVGDSNDIGFIGHIQRGATDTHVGLIRKATQNQFYLFDNYEVEPTNNVIDVSGNNFRVGNLRLGIINANSFVTSAGLDVTVQANAAYGQANAAYGQANTARSDANTTFATVNTTFATINTTTATMNTATTNRVLKAGDTMTGQLNISSGGLLVTGNSNFDSGTLFVDSVNDRIGIGTSSPLGKLDIASGNTVFSGTKQFIIADLSSSGTGSNARLHFQTSNVNSSTIVGALPSGTGISSGFRAHSSSDPDNASWFQIAATSTDHRINSNYNGTGSALPITITISGSERVRFDANGNVGIGTTSPTQKLDVVGIIKSSGASNSLMFENRNDSTKTWEWYSQGTSNAGFAGLYKNHNTPGTAFVISDLGFAGIGLTNPRVPLDLGSTNNRAQVILLGETGANNRTGFGLDSATAGMRIFTVNNSSQMIDLGGISTSDGTTWTRNHRFGIAGGNSWLNEQGGNVGIGTTSPSTRLHVVTSDSAEGEVRIQNSSVNHSSGINFYTSSTQRGYIGWRGTSSTSTANTYGIHLINFDNSPIVFSTTAAERVRITDTGNVGIGTTSPSCKLDIVGTNSAIALSFGNTVPNNPLFINTYGGWSGIGMDQTTAGLRLAGDYGGGSNPLVDIGLYNSGSVSHANWVSRLRVNSNGNVGIGTTSFNTNGGKLQVADGISFPATQSACSDVNTLDDYEEGTYTPTLSTSSGTPSYQYQEGYYTKIGRQVFGGGIIGITNSGSLTGPIRISLPFTGGSSTYGYTGGTTSDGSGFTWPILNGYYSLTLQHNSNTNFLEVIGVGTSAAAIQYNTSGVSGSWYVRFNFSFRV